MRLPLSWLRDFVDYTGTPEDLADWVRFTDEAYPKIRGKLIPAEMFDEVSKLVKEYRAKAGK